MKRHLLAIALLVTTTISTLAKPPVEDRRTRLLRLRTEGAKLQNLTSFDQAYIDALHVLEQPGSCARFFGADAGMVLDRLLLQLKDERITDSRVGVRMSGRFVIRNIEGRNLSYRMFEAVQLNTNGAFYKAKVFADEPAVPNVGSFRPNTRQARVLILLHELAHLIQRNDGGWLIPDDGGMPDVSRNNTKMVEGHCGRQLRDL